MITTEKLTFEQRFEILMESFEKSSSESREEMRKIRDIQKETARIIKENSKQIGGISDSNGKVAQETIFHILEKDKTFAGITFDDVSPQVPIMKGFKTVTDIDVLMLNGDTIALIEVKYKVDKKDVNKLIFDTVDKFRENFKDYSDYKIVLGVGGMSFDDDAIQEAKQNGVGIIKVIGDKVEYHTEGIKTY